MKEKGWILWVVTQFWLGVTIYWLINITCDWDQSRMCGAAGLVVMVWSKGYGLNGWNWQQGLCCLVSKPFSRASLMRLGSSPGRENRMLGWGHVRQLSADFERSEIGHLEYICRKVDERSFREVTGKRKGRLSERRIDLVSSLDISLWTLSETFENVC